MSEYFFDDLGMTNDIDVRGNMSTELRRFKFVPRQWCQSLSSNRHQQNTKD